MIFKHNKSSETTSTSNAPERCLASLQTNDLETNIKEPSPVFNQPISSLLLNIVSRATVYRNAQLEKVRSSTNVLLGTIHTGTERGLVGEGTAANGT